MQPLYAQLKRCSLALFNPCLPPDAACKNTKKQNFTLLLLIALFFLINLDFLTIFPFVHSDESWLAGLTRNMMAERSFGVTETFFDLKPRYPHAIKSLFHLLQMPFLAVFGYEVFSVRLLSLLGGCLALILFYTCTRTMAGHTMALGATALLACDVQFIAASHLARQEVLLCCCLLACLAVLLRQGSLLATKSVVLLAVITGTAVGLHPNSFLVAAMCGCVLLLRWAVFKTAALRQLATYTVVTGGLASLFVAASFAMDRQFITHYLAYGESEFELIAPVTSKVKELSYFFKKLWHGVSGTYFVPNLKPQFIIFSLILCLALFFVFKLHGKASPQCQRVLSVAAAIGGVLVGTVVIGRYNQTSIVFFVPLFWLLLPFVCGGISLASSRKDAEGVRVYKPWLAVAVFATTFIIILSSTALCVSPWLTRSYSAYISRIAAVVPKESKVIGNLNSDFYFENAKLLDYRNLAYLKENNITLADYVRTNEVEYLIISDELKYIYSVRPKWNMIYGNIYNYRDELNAFIKASCTEVGSFVNNCYGVRIREQMNGERDFTVRIYRVN